MSIVARVTALRPLRTLKRAGEVDAARLEEAKLKLVEAGPGVIPALLDLLPQTGVREAATDVLTRLLSTETLPDYVTALAAEKPTVSRTTARILSENDGYDAARLLEYLDIPAAGRARLDEVLRARGAAIPAAKAVPFLSGDDREVRTLAFRLLEAHGDPSIVPSLLPLLGDEDMWLRLHALKLIARHPHESAIPAVTERVVDESRHVRLEAVRALGVLEARSAIPALCQCLRDANLHVHSAAIDVVIQLGDASAVPHLIEVLKDESEYARRGAVEVLNEVATTEAVSDLVGALRDEDWWVRVRAADALGSLGGERVVDAVLNLMDSDDEFIRRYAVEILNTIPDERAVEPLIKALEDQDWWVRERAIDALASTGDARAVEPLIALMEQDVQAAPLCARALGTLGDGRAVPSLCGLSRCESTELRENVLTALRELAGAGLEPEQIEQIRLTLGELPAARAANDLSVRGGRGAGPDVGRPEPRRSSRSSGPEDAPAQPPAPPPSAPAPVQAPPVAPDRLDEGDMLLDRYRVRRRIGSGGFGSVFLVDDTAVDEELVLKILNPQVSADESNLQRFVHELKFTRRITHKNVIRIHDLLDLGGAHAISMEYHEGKDLGTILEEEGRLPVDRGLAIATQIAEGLVAAHAEGIVHRDMKPPNVLVDESGLVKIVDFGLASITQHTGSRLTKSGVLIGTPHYMAPEQITGGEIDGRTDIYSVGVLMYEMFAGAPPITGDNAVALLFQHLEGEVTPLCEAAPHVSPELEQLVSEAMCKEPEGRMESAEALLERLRALAD